MLNQVIALALKNRLLILAGALTLIVFGSYQATELSVDVFPDLNRPTVTVMTEVHGLAPEEVETLVTFPIEAAVNGATGVQRVRSASGIGISIVYVEFDWDADINQARRVVSERLQLTRGKIPAGAVPVMTPMTSIMGEIMLVGIQATGPTGPLRARTLADWRIRPRLLGISGVAQVTVMGGEQKQYQVLTSPEQLARYDVTLDELTTAVEKSNAVSGGGFLQSKEQEKLIRVIGRAMSLDDIRQSIVKQGEAVPITIGMVSEVKFAGPVKRGDASIHGQPAVVLSIQKQPGSDTISLTRQVLEKLDEVQRQQPDLKIETNIFKQADFIQTAIRNVEQAVRDGAVWVVVVLFIFLWNFRTSLISLTAIPFSILITALVFRYFGFSINTMTLGGLAVAIGELVDDSIVDVENIYRRLKNNRQQEHPESVLKIVFLASAEIRNSIVYATLIVVLVVFPLFSLGGLEGRMFAPLGLSYLITLAASLLVSLTVTPVLASYLLPNARFLDRGGDTPLVRSLKSVNGFVLRFALKHNTMVLLAAMLLVHISVVSVFWMGGDFLPAFNEGTLTLGMTTPAETNLQESGRLASRAEQMLLEIAEVKHVSRRTGRAELDEHAENVNYSEIDVGLKPPYEPKPGVHNLILRWLPGLHRWGVREVGRPRAEVLADIRERLAAFPSTAAFNIGQPISHRLDHIMSGIRAQIAVKIFGDELKVLRAQAEEVRVLMEQVDGVVDLQVEQQVEIEQIRMTVRREEATRYGLPPRDIAAAIETAFQGHTVSQVLEGQRAFDLVVWFDEGSRNNLETIRNTMLKTPSGAVVSLSTVADVETRQGPNTIYRENVMRRIVIQCNTSGRDLVSVVNDVRRAIGEQIVETQKLPEGYFIEFDGQFEAQQAANFRLLVLGSFSVCGIFLLLYKCFGSWRAALQVMMNIPLAAIGVVLALLLTHWPGMAAFRETWFWEWPALWLENTSLSVAHWVGFVTLIGIVTRNGIMMISHYLYLMKYEDEAFSREMIIRGSQERLVPVLMTALTTAIGLVPLALGAGQTGKEILHPLSIVVIGGLLSSTLLDQLVTPALFWRFGSKITAEQGIVSGEESAQQSDVQRLAAELDG